MCLLAQNALQEELNATTLSQTQEPYDGPDVPDELRSDFQMLSSFLESEAALLGQPGPASALLSQLGLRLPRPVPPDA